MYALVLGRERPQRSYAQCVRRGSQLRVTEMETLVYGTHTLQRLRMAYPEPALRVETTALAVWRQA